MARTNTRRIQEILFAAICEAAKHTEPTAEGASILAVVIGESLADISTELMARGDVLREPGGVDKAVRATIDPIEARLRENIAAYLAAEAAETRQ